MFQNPSDSVQGEFSADHRKGPPSAACEGWVALFIPNWDYRGTEGGNEGERLKRERLGCRGTDGRRERKQGGGWQKGQRSGLECVFMRVCVSACVCVYARGLGHALLFTLYCLIIDGLNWYPNNESRLPQMSRRPSDPLTYLPTHPNTGFLSHSLSLSHSHTSICTVWTPTAGILHICAPTQDRAGRWVKRIPVQGVISWLKSIKEKSCKYNKIITLWEPVCARMLERQLLSLNLSALPSLMKPLTSEASRFRLERYIDRGVVLTDL